MPNVSEIDFVVVGWRNHTGMQFFFVCAHSVLLLVIALFSLVETAKLV